MNILPSRRQTMFDTLGVIVLIAGISTAGIVYWKGYAAGRVNNQAASAADGEWKDGTIPPEDSKIISRDIELYNGKVGVLMWKWTEALKRPETLAILMAAGSALVALGCFLAARRPSPGPQC